MKVLFVIDGLALHHEPLGIMQLTACLRRAGHDAALLNGEAAGEGLADAVRASGAGLVGFSSTTGSHRMHLAMAARIKAALPALPIVMGNAHPTFFPGVLDEEPCLDFICRGEGDDALVELAHALEGRGDPAAIPNIDARLADGSVRRNPLRPFREDLDALPFPDRGILAGLTNAFEGATSYFISGRGCPYNCSYCFNHSMRSLAPGRYVRRRSVDNVIEELRQVTRANRTRLVNFQDDTFILDRQWVEEFVPRYRREIGLPYFCHVRANLVDERMAALLGESGCVVACLGLETGNERLRNDVLRRNMSSEQILRACRLLRAAGMDVITQNMVGVPHETVATFWQTLDLNRRAGARGVQIYHYRPHPGTDLARLAHEEHLFSGDYDLVSKSYFERLDLTLPEGEVLDLLARVGNLVIDVWAARALVRAVLVLPVGRRVRRRVLEWLDRHQNGIRRRLGCRDSRWAPLERYQRDAAPVRPT